jgi:hypothetical protein
MWERLDNAKPQALLLAGSGSLIIGLAMGLIWTDAMLHGYLCAFAFFLGAPLGSVALLMLNELIPGRWATPLRSTFRRVRPHDAVDGAARNPADCGGCSSLRRRALGERNRSTCDLPEHAVFLWACGRVPAAMAAAYVCDRSWCPPAIAQRRDGALPGPRCRGCARVRIHDFVRRRGLAGGVWIITGTRARFGLYVLLGQVLLALSLTILTAQRDATETEDTEQARDVRRDMGTVLLAFVALHAYIGFLAIPDHLETAILPHEISWYVRRTQGIWLIVPIAFGGCCTSVLPFRAAAVAKHQRKPRMAVARVHHTDRDASRRGGLVCLADG